MHKISGSLFRLLVVLCGILSSISSPITAGDSAYEDIYQDAARYFERGSKWLAKPEGNILSGVVGLYIGYTVSMFIRNRYLKYKSQREDGEYGSEEENAAAQKTFKKKKMFLGAAQLLVIAFMVKSYFLAKGGRKKFLEGRIEEIVKENREKNTESWYGSVKEHELANSFGSLIALNRPYLDDHGVHDTQTQNVQADSAPFSKKDVNTPKPSIWCKESFDYYPPFLQEILWLQTGSSLSSWLDYFKLHGCVDEMTYERRLVERIRLFDELLSETAWNKRTVEEIRYFCQKTESATFPANLQDYQKSDLKDLVIKELVLMRQELAALKKLKQGTLVN